MIAPLAECSETPREQHREQRARPEHDGEAVLQIGPVAARERGRALQEPCGDPRDEHRRDEERHGVDPVRSVRPPLGREHAAEQRPDRPGGVLHRLQERVRAAEQLVGDEVRHARVDSRTEEARREARHERERDDRRRRSSRTAAPRRRRRAGDRRRSSACGARAGRAAGRARDRRRCRQEVDDEDRADPEPGVRPLLHVDRERDRREQRPDARGERRGKEEPKADDTERRQLPGGAAGQSRPRVTRASVRA